MNKMNSITITSSCIQLCKGQDFVFIGENEQFKIMAIFDGHGTSKVIDYIRKISKTNRLTEILTSESPCEKLAKDIDDNANVRSFEPSGSTMCLVRISYINKSFIEYFSVGDSRILSFEDDKLTISNEVHDASNKKELERLKNHCRFNLIEDDHFAVLDEHNLTPSKTVYVKFLDSNRKLAPTQVLGHCGISGIMPWYYREEIPVERNKVIYIFSDGIEDMLGKHELLDMYKFKTAEDLSSFIEKRWKQEWKAFDRPCKFDDSEFWDDISVIRINL